MGTGLMINHQDMDKKLLLMAISTKGYLCAAINMEKDHILG